MQVAKLRNIVKRYGNALALDHVDLDIHEGEILGLLGPNGAGKTTLIHALAGLVGIDSGSIEVFGKNQRRHLLDIKRDIGLVTQDIAIFEDMVPGENLAFFGGIYGLKGNALKTRIAETLAFVGLSEHAKKTPAKFSGGMKRRLNIACALVHRPKLLIMDEPTVGIDPQSRNHILESVRELRRRGTTILYTTHYMEEVEALASRVVILDQGHVIAQGTVDDLVRHIQHEEKMTLEVAEPGEPLLAKLRAIHGVKTVARDGSRLLIVSRAGTDTLDRVLAIAREAGGVRSVNAEKPNLEDVFLTLTGKQLRDGGRE
ncbi:ABC transporter ATP-binding protein [Cohnella massiliensis]|uniref:ABC transporter ATP-binding protein n=1 Tax=Cohnella massiliensis TaxID=1816691 RepID=UPI0009BB02DB|nr:ABC transporter ATP-binding protein [Cohnella massiliensis]